MQTLAIIGAQWGDEGKGKITDLLGAKADVVVRFQGGNNAGHTIIVGNEKTVLHQIPSGILHPHCTAIIAHGVVFEPEAFFQEASELGDHIQVTPERLKISASAFVINRYHKLLDWARESKGKTKIGTTGKGIGPCYEDKVARRGIKVNDLFDYNLLVEKLGATQNEKIEIMQGLYGMKFGTEQFDLPTIEEEATRLFELGKKIQPFVTDTFSYLDQQVEAGKKILFEGAQGVLLDIDYGSYPFVTSSSTSASGIFSGAGMASGRVDERMGIVKAYTTRVGEGPFPTEIAGDLGNKIQTIGNEFGATTGRKRRCGWLDLPLLKYSIKASSLSSLAITKLDVLSEVEELNVCYAYEVDGKEITQAYPGLDYSKVKPIYKSFQPFSDQDWKQDALSTELEDYLKFIEDETKTPIGIIAFGPERDQIHFRKDYLH